MQAREAARKTLSTADGTPIILGGDCATSLPGLEAAVRKYGDALAVLWFDAHPDLQHPSTSPSGAASGMTLRHALGDGSAELAARDTIACNKLTLVGTREIDPEEQIEIDRRQITVISATETHLEATIARRLRESGATHVYVHLDLDVLDPAEFMAVHRPVPFGLSVAQATAAIRSAVSTLPLAGAAICEFAPTDAEQAAEELPTVLRLLAAVTFTGES
jgi:arginase